MLRIVLACLLAAWPATAWAAPVEAPTGVASPMRAVAVRLGPGAELKSELARVAKAHGLKAASVVSCVGSLTGVSLRYANQPEATAVAGPLEIVSLVGTLGPDGAHLHLAVADGSGRTLGGHLAGNAVVYTTAEVVLAELEGAVFRRLPDARTGYHELEVQPR